MLNESSLLLCPRAKEVFLCLANELCASKLDYFVASHTPEPAPHKSRRRPTNGNASVSAFPFVGERKALFTRVHHNEKHSYFLIVRTLHIKIF